MSTFTPLALTVDQFAQQMQISKPSAYAMTKIEGFPCLHVGKKILIPISALEKWLNDSAGSLMALPAAK